MSDESAAVLFCLFLPALLVVAFLLWRTRRQVAKLTSQLAEQQTALTGLLQRLGQTDAAPPDALPQPPTTADILAEAAPVEIVPIDAPPSEASPPLAKPAEPLPAAPDRTPPPVSAVESPLAAAPQTEADKPSIFQPFLDWFLGMAIVVRVGIVLLFIGVALLFRYAVDQGWLSVEVRLAGAALLGGLLVAIGWRLRQRQPVYALTLQGGGFGIAYMTVFAAFRLYELLPGLPAFLLLLALVTLCMALAVLNDSRALAVLAIGGGFLAPILASTGEGSHVALFGYYLVLNVGILGVAWFKAWRELNLLGFVFTFVLGLLWGADFYQPAFFATVEPFLFVFFLFYVAIAILFTRRQPPVLLGFVDGPLVFGTPLVALALQRPLVADFPNGLAWSAAGAGLLYLLLAALLGRGAGPNYRPLVRVFVPLGTILLTLAVPLAFANDTTSYLWAIEGAALVWLGLRQRGQFNQYFGSFLQVAAGIALATHLIVAGFEESTVPPILNSYYAGALVVALSAFASSYFFLSSQRAEDATPNPLHSWLHWLLTAYGLAWWYLGGVLETVIVTQQTDANYLLAGLLSFVALSCLAGEIVGSRLAWRSLGLPWLALGPLIGLAYLIGFVTGDPPFAYGGWYSFLLAFAVHYWILRRWDGEGWQRLYHAAGLWLIGLVGTTGIAGLVLERLPLAWEEVVVNTYWAALWPLWFVLLMAAVSGAGQRLAWPTARHYRFYVGPLLVLPALILAGWSVDVNARFSGAPGLLPYLPVLNPIGLSNLLVLGLLLLWLQQLKRMGFPLQLVKAGRLGVIFVIFFWVNVEMARTVHHWQNLPFRLEAIFDSPLLQAAYAIVWGVLALVLMFGATRRGVRWVWMLGGALLALTVLKLLFVDLAGTGTVARIVSFLGVGLLMTVIGYFAPVPPTVEEKAAGISAGDVADTTNET